MPMRRVNRSGNARHLTTRSDDGTVRSNSGSSPPSYDDGSRVKTVGSQPQAERYGASKRTRCVAALESGGKWGLMTRALRMEDVWEPVYAADAGRVRPSRRRAAIASGAGLVSAAARTSAAIAVSVSLDQTHLRTIAAISTGVRASTTPPFDHRYPLIPGS